MKKEKTHMRLTHVTLKMPKEYVLYLRFHMEPCLQLHLKS